MVGLPFSRLLIDLIFIVVIAFPVYTLLYIRVAAMPYFSICRLAKSMMLIMPSMSAILAFLKRCPISLLY